MVFTITRFEPNRIFTGNTCVPNVQWLLYTDLDDSFQTLWFVSVISWFNIKNAQFYMSFLNLNTINVKISFNLKEKYLYQLKLGLRYLLQKPAYFNSNRNHSFSTLNWIQDIKYEDTSNLKIYCTCGFYFKCLVYKSQ